MFRKSKADEISAFLSLPLKSNDIAAFYLGVSGFIVRSSEQTVIFDPAGMLKDDELRALKTLDLLLFTHDHLDHFNSGKTLDIFRATGAPVLAEAKVASKLRGRLPTDKLTSAEPNKTYAFGDLTATTIQGIHRGPIMLFQLRMDGATLFHGGDSGYVNLKDFPSKVAIVPVGRMSPTASPENAYKMVADLKPEIAVAMHGSDKQKRQFEAKVKETMPQTKVVIMQPFTFQTFPIP